MCIIITSLKWMPSYRLTKFNKIVHRVNLWTDIVNKKKSSFKDLSFENELYIQSFEKYWMNWEPKSWLFRSTKIYISFTYHSLLYKSLKYIRKQAYIFLKIDCMITYLLHFFRICNYLNIYILFRGGGGSFNFIYGDCFQHDLFINLFI